MKDTSFSRQIRLGLLVLWMLTPMAAFSKIWLPSVLSDGMVLQQQSKARLWGWTTVPSESLTIIGSWNNTPITVKADKGQWTVALPTPLAGGPYTVTIKGHETLVIRDVMIGEVWICSGQSNMEWTPNQGLDNKEAEIAAANHPNIRFFKVTRRWSDHPQEDVLGQWQACSPKTLPDFSSVAYFFGRRLQKELNVPIGLIATSWGGTPVETWIPKEVLYADKELWEASKKIAENPWRPSAPGKAYNGMIHPLRKIDMAGVIWYQGESNRANADSYYQSFPLLIQTWRTIWGKEFPFFFVQLAPFKYDGPEQRQVAVVRDAQWHALKTVPKTGMAVTMDIGNLGDIHPTNKQDVGKRLALWALAKTYGKDLLCSGPEFKSFEVKGKKAIVDFYHKGGGLMASDKALTYFEVAGKDQVFYPAKARIKKNKVEVYSDKVKHPVSVRFAFTNGPQPNLFNSEGLPALPFRTDDWPIELE
ncbi:MAG: sialate O-acetylesterase [Flavobacteriaceae bacterium]